VPANSVLDFIYRVQPRGVSGAAAVTISATTSAGILINTAHSTWKDSGPTSPHVALPFIEGGAWAFSGSVANRTGPKTPSPSVSVAWTRLSDWLPWMKMRGRAGLIYFNGAGVKLASYGELPAGMRAAIEARNPTFKEPPPVDDARPNETSWSYFKKMLPAPEGK